MIFQSKAFTLIELLVVVLIIAILAAIAVPNFLAAQTRAKVSRAKADIKTIVTGIESYAVDNNKYPTYHYGQTALSQREFRIGGTVTSFGTSPPFDGKNPLTTPISYISTMPSDPFTAHRDVETNLKEYLYVNWDYALLRAVPNVELGLAFLQARREYGAYRIHSLGPDIFGPDSGLPYDASNGTISTGDITYGPASGFDKLTIFD